MKKILFTIASVFILLATFISITSCNPTVTGEGPIVDVKKDADKFSKVDMQMEADVLVKQGAENSVIIHAQENIANAIDVVVSRKTLKIYSEKNLQPSEPITIDVVMNSLEELEISGSGIMKSSGTLKAPDLNLRVSGSGKMFLDVVCNKLKSDISGSGQITLKGSATESNLEISGSGHLYAYDLLTEIARTEISGSGNAEVAVSSQLTAKISGSGNVTYKGNPPTINQKVSGSGNIKRAQ